MKKRWGHALITAAVCGGIAGGEPIAGPVVFDGSLGPPGGALTGNTVFAGRGVAAGANLFHSFSRFNVLPGQTVTFEVPQATRNVLARVTGGELSQIDGTIATDRAANLYLINPAGVFFGHGASVDVAGSFTATTADYVAFENGAGIESRYWASIDGPSTLVSDPPSRFGFLDSGSEGRIGIELGNADDAAPFATGNFSAVGRAIEVTDSAFVDTGALVFQTATAGELGLDGPARGRGDAADGGDISFTNVIVETFTGQAIKIQAEGNLTLAGDGFINTSGNTGPGTIGLSAGGDLVVSGVSVRGSHATGTAAGVIGLEAGGSIRITGGGQVKSDQRGAGTGADISIRAGGGLTVDAQGSVFSEASRGGQGGEIGIDAGGEVMIRDFGLIQSSADVKSHGGRIRLAAGTLRIDGPAEARAGDPQRLVGIESVITAGSTVAGPTGKGADIQVDVAGGVWIQNTGGIFSSTNGAGQSGTIGLTAGRLEITGARNFLPGEESLRPSNFFITGISNKGALDQGTGSLGSITVDVAGEILLRRGGFIDATNFSLNPAAKSGDVTVSAASISADRQGSDYFTGIGAGTVADGDAGRTNGGDGGTVMVRAGAIELMNGAQIAASSRSGGDAGTVRVMTDRLSASGSGPETDFLFTGESGVVAATLGVATGNGGSVFISGLDDGSRSSRQAPRITLSEGAEIGARVDGSGTGGLVDIRLGAGRLTLDSGASVSARSGTRGGTAGSVFIQARDITVMNGASISSRNDTDGTGGRNAGSVTLHPGVLRVVGGRLEVSAVNGDGGDLVIEGGRLLDFRNADLVAEVSRESGGGGNVTIRGARQVLLENSRVIATASEGAGGNIGIKPLVLFQEFTTLDASSETGVDGVVEVDSQVTLSGAEGELEVSPLDATDSLQPECTDRLATKAGSFIRAGRGGAARLPGGYVPSMRLHRGAP